MWPVTAGSRPVLTRFLTSSLIVAALIYLLVVIFPGRYAPFGGPFEESWVYEINRLTAESGWRCTAFSYGPLGFLLYPRDIGVNLLVAIGFYLFVHLLFAALISYHAIRAASRLSVFLFVAGYTLAAALGLQGLGYEYHLLIVYGLLLAIRPEHRRAQFAAALSCGMLAAMLLLLKFNLGLCALGMLMVRCLTDRLPASAARSWSLEALQRRLFPAHFASAQVSRQTWPFALGAAVGYLLSMVGIGLAYLGRPGDFFNWLRFSLDIALQYSVALSLAGPRDLTYLALLGIAVYLVTAIWLGRRDPTLRLPLCVFAVLIAFVFKGGFVRQGGQDARRALLTVALRIAEETRRRDAIVRQQLAYRPRVLGGDERDFAEEAECP